ncbi:hypothetical protein GQ53DRAFT_49527 [Thozetella sp. PMI_491]|nr:hypothetical protein GQ53DRAFT_49527 [Thozetella sp. PMI_491]
MNPTPHNINAAEKTWNNHVSYLDGIPDQAILHCGTTTFWSWLVAHSSSQVQRAIIGNNTVRPAIKVNRRYLQTFSMESIWKHTTYFNGLLTAIFGVRVGRCCHCTHTSGFRYFTECTYMPSHFNNVCSECQYKDRINYGNQPSFCGKAWFFLPCLKLSNVSVSHHGPRDNGLRLLRLQKSIIARRSSKMPTTLPQPTLARHNLHPQSAPA